MQSATKKARRIRQARMGALTGAVIQLGTAAMVLWGRCFLPRESLVSALLLILAVLALAGLVPIGMVYRTRMKEIEGGEEDAAAEY